jgi:Domain of unknown function (DUF4129)
VADLTQRSCCESYSRGERPIEPREPRLSRLRPTTPLGIAAFGTVLLALLAVVALAARAHHTPGGRPGVHRPPSGVGSYLFSTAAVVAVAACLFFLYVWFSERDMLAQRRQHRRGSAKALVFILGVALLASILSHFHNFGFRNRAKPEQQQKVHPGQHAKTKPNGAAPGQTQAPEFKWLPVFVATAAGMVLLGAIGIRAMRRARRGLEEQYVLERELESLLDDTLADLYAMRDPREAIIAAYGRMERLFASSGLPREPSEAPMEYLDRALGELRASGAALRRLTALFQWAKFSAHDVDARMRDEAIRALTLVRDELKANRQEDDVRRAEADAAQRERASDGSEDRTYGENPFATVGDKVRGDPNTIR